MAQFSFWLFILKFFRANSFINYLYFIITILHSNSFLSGFVTSKIDELIYCSYTYMKRIEKVYFGYLF